MYILLLVLNGNLMIMYVWLKFVVVKGLGGLGDY